MRASSPTEVCYNVGMSFPGWPRHLPLAVGADSISACGRLRRRRVRRDGASRPTAARTAAAIPVGQKKKLFVGAGFIPPAGVRAAAGFPGRCEHRPLQRFAITWECRFPVGRGPHPVCRGGPWPSRGTLRYRISPVGIRVSPRSVGRAFTPAAPWRFQNRNLAPPQTGPISPA